MHGGRSINSDYAIDAQEPVLNGYSIIEAEDVTAAGALVAKHPYAALGPDHTVELYEIPN
jgi:hypothetical protein